MPEEKEMSQEQEPKTGQSIDLSDLVAPPPVEQAEPQSQVETPKVEENRTWLYTSNELESVKNKLLRNQLELLGTTPQELLDPDLLRDEYMETRGLVTSGVVELKEALPFIDKIGNKLIELRREREKATQPREQVVNVNVEPSVPEEPKDKEGWMKLVQSRIYELSLSPDSYKKDWLEEIKVRESGKTEGHPNALQLLLSKHPELAYTPISYEYGGQTKEKPLHELLVNMVTASERIYKRYEAWTKAGFKYSTDGIEKLSMEAGNLGVELETKHLEALSTFLPDTTGYDNSQTPMGDLISTCFLAYRGIASQKEVEIVNPQDRNSKYKFAATSFDNIYTRQGGSKTSQTRERVRQWVAQNLIKDQRAKDKPPLRFAEDVAFKLMSVFGEAAWADKAASGPACDNSDALSYLMHLETYRKKERIRGSQGPNNTVEGAYPKSVLKPFTLMFKVKDGAQEVEIAEILDQGRPLRDINLHTVPDEEDPDGNFRFMASRAAKFYKFIMDTDGTDTKVSNFADFNKVVGILVSAKVFSPEEQRKARYNLIKGLEYVIVQQGTKMERSRFWREVVKNALSAGTISKMEAWTFYGSAAPVSNLIGKIVRAFRSP